MQEVRMGFAQVDITPQYPVQLVGYDARPDNMSRGILHNLVMQTIVWKNSTETCCLVAVDSLGFTVELARGLRDRVADVLKIDSQCVMICFSHTHAAPNAAIESEYFEMVCEKAVISAKRASLHAGAIIAAWGIAENTVGINRRGSACPIDNRLGILKVCDAEQGQLRMLLLRVTAHGNVLMPDNYLISPDYFGTTRDLLEKQYGCPIVIVQGAAGNVRPKFRQDNADYLEIHPAEAAKMHLSDAMRETYLRQSRQALADMAREIRRAVQPVLAGMISRSIGNLSMFSVERTFYADVPTLERANEIAAEGLQNGIDGRDWLDEVKRLLDQGVKRQSSAVEIQYFVIGDGCICGISNEAMSEIATEISRKANDPLLFFNGYTNGCGSYLPTAEEYDRGGYEVLWSNLLYYRYHGRVMPFNRDTAAHLADDIAGARKRKNPACLHID